jgi:2-polyprenyl-3-methyl-5-hydroxy-6-metoxy-1,4-benzoquinol methylase
VRDLEHGLAGSVDFAACQTCGWLTQAPPPTRESLRAAYPADYRPYISDRRAAGAAALLRRLKDLQASGLAAKLRPFLPADQDAPILDLGCGSGHLLFALQAKGYRRLTGVDQNPNLLSAFAGSSIRYLPRDLEAAEGLEGPYGAIVMVNVIEHFLHPDEILARCRNSLLPGGKIIVITPNSAGLSHQIFGAYWSGLHAPRHTQVFAPGNFRQLAARLGFATVRTQALIDPGSWAISFQNRVRGLSRQPRAMGSATAWYSLALLPLWYSCAVLERLAGCASSFLTVLACAPLAP